MSQIWNLLHKDLKSNDHHHDEPEQHLQNHEPHHSEQHTIDSSCSSSSTIKTETIDDTLKSPVDHPHHHQQHNEFDAQLRDKLSKLALKKKKLKKRLQPKSSPSSPNDTTGDSEIHDDDELDDEVKEIGPLNIRSMPTLHSNHESSTHLSPSASYLSSSSSNIFERSVQDQATMSSISRRNSFNQMAPSFRSQSATSLSPILTTNSTYYKNNNCNCDQIPNHLNSEVFIPTCLDASTEILTNNDANLEDVEVIQSTNPHFTDVLDQTYYHSKRKNSLSSPIISRRHTFNSVPQSPITSSLPPPALNYHRSSTSSSQLSSNFAPSQQLQLQGQNIVAIPLTKTSTNSSSKFETLPGADVDYSDRNKLNFCSFADLLSDELLQGESQDYQDHLNIDNVMNGNISNDSEPLSPVSRKNSTIFVVPALSLTKTNSNLR